VGFVTDTLIVADAGISGASRHNRPALLDLFARIGEWDVLLCWDSSRLARDSENLGWIRNRLHARKRVGFEASTGLDLFNVGAKVLGVMNEEFLVKLRADTQRGLRGRAERGLSTGGLAYGYRSEPVAIDEHGRPVESAGYRIRIDDAEAAVVRRIFDLYLGGEGLRAIAHALNAEGILTPRARAHRSRRSSWAPTAIREMIRNQIYVGARIFNRSEWIKDHETGKRRRYERPTDEWVRQTDETLRIVSDETFAAAREHAERRGTGYNRSADGRRIAGPIAGGGYRARGRGLFSGLLACGECGGAFYGVKRADRLCCGWRVDRGATVCTSDLAVPRDALEARILGAVRGRIFAPESLTYFIERALGLVEQGLSSTGTGTDRDAERLVEIDAEIGNSARLAARTGHVDAVAQLIVELEQERQNITRRLAVPKAHAFDADGLRARVGHWAADLRGSLEGSPDDCRRVFLGLLGGRRMRVAHGVDGDFRVEGVFELPWNEKAPSASFDNRGGSTRSGGLQRPITQWSRHTPISLVA
jgi:DNA invertase Pin-like site-specific DNA recombinase